MNIELRKIDEHNWREVIALEVHTHQKNFVASNLRSLAECYVNPGGCEHHPLAIYDEGKAVGFALYVRDDEDSSVQWIKRFMIDKKHQRLGLGRAALVRLVELIGELEACREINLTVVPENTAAQNFYRSLGFIYTERMHEGEMIFSLPLKNLTS